MQGEQDPQNGIRRWRVGREVVDLYEQAAVGFLLGTVVRVGLDISVICGMLYGLHYAFNSIMQEAACVQHCFSAKPHGKCCSTNPLFVMRALAYLAAIAIGSFFSTHFKKKKKFQHSAAVTAILTILAVLVLLHWGKPFFVTMIAAAGVFFASFFGYSSWFRVRKILKSK